jgi:DNA-binding winged helix-turn-helix (wHTH) protein/tetratricopeptide (TPR) repeat protein
MPARADQRELPVEGGSIDLGRLEVRRGEVRVRLTAIEAALLAYLADRPGQAITREELQAEVWGYKEGLVTRAVHHTVTRLRRKLELDPDAPKHLVSVYGVGYRLELATAPTPASPPPASSTFVGRADELVDLARCFDEGARLVTLYGCGGMGKTSLARRHLATTDGVWCDLVGVTGHARLARIVLDVLGGEPGADPDAAVVAALRARGRVLLVLDDLDALAEVAGPIVASWLARAPEARVLVTSRRWLAVPEEVRVELAPMRSGDGLALLRARAPTAGEADADDLRALVDALAGLPLAIVLAAPRLAVVSARALRERLAAPLALLRSRAPLASQEGGRHATMRGVLDWSWHQLEPEERHALPALALFEGGFTAEAAEAVIGGDGRDADVLDVLEGLLRASWIVPLAGERLGMYPVQREYLLERLAERADPSGEAGAAATPTAIGGRHLRWCLGVLEAANASLDARWNADAARRAAAEVPNGLAAFDREVAREPALAAALLVAVWPLATRANPIEEARLDAAIASMDGLLASGVAGPDARSAAMTRARLGWLRGLARRLAGRGAAAREALDDALARADALGDLDIRSLVVGQLGNLAAVEGRLDEAAAHFRAACVLNDARGARVAVWLGNLGNVHRALGDRDAAEACYLEALARVGEDGNPGDRARLHANLGNLQLARGDLEAAEDSYGRAETLFRDADERASLAQVAGNRAVARLGLGRLDEARTLAVDARERNRRLGNRRSEAIATLTLAEIDFEAGRVAEALEHALLGATRLEELRDRVFLAAAQALVGTCHHARGALPAALSAWEEAAAGFDALGNTQAADHARIGAALVRIERSEPHALPHVADATGLALRTIAEAWAGLRAGDPHPWALVNVSPRSRHPEARRARLLVEARVARWATG